MAVSTHLACLFLSSLIAKKLLVTITIHDSNQHGGDRPRKRGAQRKYMVMQHARVLQFSRAGCLPLFVKTEIGAAAVLAKVIAVM